MYKHYHQRSGILAPDAEMWTALRQGAGLREILEKFYTLVYQDPKLSPFFDEVTRERAIDKQFSFLRSIFTGEKSYFGQHPKSAHHWMVISNDLFDYREQLMVTVLEEYGLTQLLIDRWMQIEEVFRKVIVKSEPFDLKFSGKARPANGYFYEVVEISTLCDHCGAEIDAGSEVVLHIRTGKVHCGSCADKQHLKVEKHPVNPVL